MKRFLSLTCLLFLTAFALQAQKGGTVRGKVFEKDSGDPVMFATVLLEGTSLGTNTDIDGFFSIPNIPAGDYTLKVTYVGFDDYTMNITIREAGIVFENIYLISGGIQLEGVEVSARKAEKKTEVKVSTVTISKKQIQSLPSVSGEADIAQYLPVLPGVITTGDQGGQLYIRGGSPIQNKILLDGMTIYSPFHSIGFFSVFETEAIRNVEVMTGGFNAEHGDRISAIVDIRTREGDKKRFGGVVSANPFMSKILLEGPLRKLDENSGSSVSYILTGKRSFIDKTSPTLYPHASSAITNSEDPEGNGVGLPYSFTDVYGKVSVLSGNGTKLDVFGFNFRDGVDYAGLATLGWNSFGFGSNFKIIPPNSALILGGQIAYSDYKIELDENDGNPRKSGIETYSGELNFTYFGNNSEFKYGLVFSSFSTDFKFRNFLGNTIEQVDNTTQVAGFARYRQTIGALVIEPSLRASFYTSQQKSFLEPRLGIKLNAGDNLRFKFASGFYTQNLVSTVNDNDVVNLFSGYLSGPEERIFLPGTTEEAAHRIQTAFHVIGGLEIDLSDKLELNIEPYFKDFSQLISLNRNKLRGSDPDFQIEYGKARGIDLSLRYSTERMYLWSTYSLGKVTRDDGNEVYPTIFDRRHNVNLLATYAFGEDKDLEVSARWNFGSGFPVTRTQGFYEQVNVIDGLDENILTANGDLGVEFEGNRNGGFLTDFHRLDLSIKKTFTFSKYSSLETVLAVTNAYNHDNIFYINRVSRERVDQLPILPSLGVTYRF